MVTMMYESFGSDIKRADRKFWFKVFYDDVMEKFVFASLCLLAEIVNFVGNCVLKSIHKSLSPCQRVLFYFYFVMFLEASSKWRYSSITSSFTFKDRRRKNHLR